MHFAERNLKQYLTYWPPVTNNVTNAFGHASLGTPRIITGRWEERTQTIRKPNGDEFVSQIEVLVSEDVEAEGYLVLGQYTDEASPIRAAREIADFRKTPDLRNLGYERRAYL